MKLLRVGEPGKERPAVRTDDGMLLDLSSVTADIDGAFLDSGGLDRARAAVEEGGLPVLDAAGLRIGAPVARPGKIICVGLNYLDHAAETGAAVVSARRRCSGSRPGRPATRAWRAPATTPSRPSPRLIRRWSGCVPKGSSALSESA